MNRKTSLLALAVCSLATLVYADLPPPLAPVDLDNWIQRNPPATGVALESLTFANNVYLSLGAALQTSLDGTNWTGRYLPVGSRLLSAAYGNGIFVAVGGGRIVTSTDAVIWTEPSGGTNTWLINLNSVAYGDGAFVAVGWSWADGAGVVLTSPDGAVWTQRSTGTGFPLQAITSAQGIFVVVGLNGSVGVILTSPDGAAWTERYRITSEFAWSAGVAFGNETFVAVGRGVSVVSRDGVSWTQQATPINTDLYSDRIAFGNGVFVVGGESTFTSSNGVNWAEHDQRPANLEVEGLTFGNGLFVATGPPIATSHDGVTWTPHGDGTITNVLSLGNHQLNAVAYGSGTFVAVGQGCDGFSCGIVATSPDGTSWTRQERLNGDLAGGEIYRITYADGKFVAIGSGGAILTSPDGISGTWNRIGASDLRDVTYGNGMFVAVGNTIVTSTDGTNWSEQSVDTQQGLSGVGFGNGLFVAAGGDYILTSPDGMAWTPQRVRTNALLRSVAYGNGVFLAVGGFAGPRSGVPVVMTSPDGITWTSQTVGVASALFRLSFANGTFVAVANSYYDGYTGSILTSTDGRNWVHRYRQGWQEGLFGVTFGNGSFIAVGQGGRIVQSGRRPQFHSGAPARLEDGSMRVALETEPGAELLLEASTNLVDWARLGTLTNRLGTASFLDLAATNFSQRFYRAGQISK